MKKFLLLAIAFVSVVGLTACENSAEKTADKIENHVAQGDELQMQGLREYQEAQLYLNGLVKGQTAVNYESVDKAISLLSKSKTTLLSSKASYNKAISVHNANRDEVK